MQAKNETFLRAVDSLVKVHGLKQKDIAAQIGIRPTYLSQLVHGRPPSDTIVNLVELLLFQKDSQKKTAETSNVRTAGTPSSTRRVPVVAWAMASAYLDHYGGNFSDLANQIDESVETECKDPNAYALIVEGDSMSPRFCAGDRIITAPNCEPRNGDYVVARLRDSGQVLFKVFRRTGAEGRVVRLESLNPAYAAVEYPESAFRLIHPVVDAKMNLKR